MENTNKNNSGSTYLTSISLPFQIVVDAGNVGWYTSLAINGSDIYISYNDVTNGSLKLAKSTDNGVTW